MHKQIVEEDIDELLNAICNSNGDVEYVALNVFDGEELIGLEEVRSLLCLLRNSCSKKIKKNGGRFYIWYDAMVGQIRVGYMFDVLKSLPFKCNLNIVDSIDNIVNDVFSEVSSFYRRGSLDVCYVE